MDVPFQFADRETDGGVINFSATIDKAGQQRFVANGIHEAGDAFGVIINAPQSGPGEIRRAFRAGNFQPMLDILVHFSPAQWAQMITNGDALAELPERVLIQTVAQFGLAQEDDLQKFPVVGFQVRQQTDLFQHFFGQVLRFIDDEHGLFALFHLAEQKFVEDGESIEAVEAELLDGQAELGGDRLHELVGVQRGIQNERSRVMTVELLEHSAAKGGLARANFAGELHETFALANSVKEVVEGFAMLRAIKQKPRIRRNVEGRFCQAVIIEIHAKCEAGKVPDNGKARGE